MLIQVCIAQIGYITEDIEAHIRKIREIILENREADLIVFPELILHGHPTVHEPEGLLHRRIRAFYRMGAQELDLFRFIREIDARVVIGDLRKRGDRFYNLATYVSRERTESYLKTHVHWTENFVPGRELKVIETPFGKIGLSICFDAAFPEVMRILALKGAKILVNIAAVPAAFPVKYVWRRLQAAALNNQAFVVYANRPGESFSGHSAVFDPLGDVLAQGMEEEQIIRAAIDLGELDRWRAEEAIFPNRRPTLYRAIGRMGEPVSGEPALTPAVGGV